MVVIVLALLFAVVGALGTAGPVAANEIRRGRESFLELVAERAASGRLADWYEEPWLDSTRGRSPGAVVPFLLEPLGAGIEADRRLEQIGEGVWLLRVRAAVLDRAGGVQTQAVRGWLVRVDSLPTDSIPHTRPASRYLVNGVQ